MSDEMLEADYEEESDQSEFDTEQEYDGEAELENPLDEVEEMEYAAELLEITDEQELDQSLGKLISRVSRAAGGIIRSPAGKALGGMLKSAAKKALPIAGRAVGTYFGGPAGGAIGGKLASAAGGIFGLELEGMSGEDQEFEVARRFVRLAASATQKAAQAPAGAGPRQRHGPPWRQRRAGMRPAWATNQL